MAEKNVRPYIRQYEDVSFDKRLSKVARWLADVWKVIWWKHGQSDWLNTTTREIADTAGTTQRNVYVMTEILIKNGYIERRKGKGQRFLYHLTERLTGKPEVDI